MALPTKRSVALLIRKAGRILIIRRPDDDDELPGIWGLPAGTLRNGETTHDLIHRIGRQKLGVLVAPVGVMAQGSQTRKTYQLEMELWEASMEGLPSHPQWKWSDMEALKPGKDQGSLCCELALRIL